ncbi:MAG: hypothetical protein K2M43_00075 [Mycoplasmoidaceae bacterium]|nr:hypothetical protein [Mycoplasmoidaceae bacterium]
MGSLSSIVKMMPGTSRITDDQITTAELKIRTWTILMNSMTLKERRNPALFRKSLTRRARVIKGSGCKPDDLNKMLNEFEKTKKKMDEIASALRKGKNPMSLLKGLN